MDSTYHSSSNSWTSANSSPVSSYESYESTNSAPLKPQNDIVLIELLVVLDKMQYQPDSAPFQRSILLNPFNVALILRDAPNGVIRLVRYFLWMEKCQKNFVWELVVTFVSCIAWNKLDDLFGYENSLKLAMLVFEAGWYAESSLLLSVLGKHMECTPIKKLYIMRTILLAESLSCRYEASHRTIRDIKTLMKQIGNTPDGLKAHIHNAIAVSLFEQCEFEGSYRHGTVALELLSDDSGHETVISILRQLSKACIARKQLDQAKFVISQAGTISYASALEDYAYYLLTVNALADCNRVQSEAKAVYHALFGYLSLQPDLAQGNLAFWLYLETTPHKEFGPEDSCLKFVVDPDDKNNRSPLTPSEDRQMLAAKRMHTLRKAAALADRGNIIPPNCLINLQPQLMMYDVKRGFTLLFE